ncbi:hypothetical protein SAMN03159443_06002 [Pseudomonas sp. NFACC15-1]|uniref:hypothetical protein n=1 Tax=unclassified Pseudomonas TaxID=196821 RepID=UPI0008810CAB|nr:MULTISPECIES: hypothetical protein [unclassified Pseudomonas]SDA97811.1 hypothetical protein SAMN03159443_06002 [Pseudomonas sp. NFACC15-1]SDB67809.1 hypothetical protein SAMN03159290_06162 [Pseudomonas sp. NFACC13-1]SDZ12725.1 hypothetical protein SAMN03159380_05490 [Pseudomonas sp. NFACC14]
MNKLLRMMFLLKVLVMLSLGSTAAWAECDEHEQHASSGQVAQGEMMLAATTTEESGDQDNDDSTIDQEPDDGGDSGEDDEGDSQT